MDKRQRKQARWRRRVVLALVLSIATQLGFVLAPRRWFHMMTGVRGDLASVRSQTVLAANGFWLIDVFASGFAGEVVYLDSDRDRNAQIIAHPEQLARVIPLRESIVPRWTAFHHGQLPPSATPADPNWMGCQLEERAEGWPFRCVRGERHTLRVRAPDAPFGWRALTTRLGYVELPNDIWIPWRPIWGGLVLDLLVLAAPIALLQWAVGRRVASHRQRRGRCVECGYDLSGVPGSCPECGAENVRSTDTD
jgi:hypothetical protein